MTIPAQTHCRTPAVRRAVTSMLLPRLAAIAEVAWTDPEQRDWEDFRGRVAGQGPFWDRLGLSWYRSPQVDW